VLYGIFQFHLIRFDFALILLFWLVTLYPEQLIKPIEFASMALRSYKEERQVPDLPLVFHDEAGFNA
jgi:hypothetical protein